MFQILSEEYVIGIISYLCSQSKADTVQILPAETKCAGNGAEVPQGEAGKGVSCPFRGEGTGVLTQALNRINIVKSVMTGCLPFIE